MLDTYLIKSILANLCYTQILIKCDNTLNRIFLLFIFVRQLVQVISSSLMLPTCNIDPIFSKTTIDRLICYSQHQRLLDILECNVISEVFGLFYPHPTWKSSNRNYSRIVVLIAWKSLRFYFLILLSSKRTPKDCSKSHHNLTWQQLTFLSYRTS